MKNNNKGLQIFISFGLAILITNIIAQNVDRKPENLIYECRYSNRSAKRYQTYRCSRIEKHSSEISLAIFVIILLVLDTIDLWKNK